MIIQQKEPECATDIAVCHRPPQARIHASEHIQGQTWARVQIQPPERPEIRDDRARLFQVLLLDISASMSTAVEQPGEKGVASVFTRLDLAKHAIKTVIMSLTDRDAVILMVYDHECTKLHDTPIAMTPDGKKAATALLESQTHNGSTSFHPAMSNAIDEILANDTNGFYTSITLFTDGEPTDYPSNGHVKALESKLKRVGNPPITINTIGFTSALKTDILLGYAKLGNGAFIYINDGSMVGTTFVNLLATEQATVATHVATTIKYTGTLNTELIADVYKYDYISADTIRVYTPHLRYGQSSDIVLPVDGIASASVQYTPVGTGARHTVEASHTISILDDDDEDSSSVAPHVARVLFAHYVHAAERAALDLIDPRTYRYGAHVQFDGVQLPMRTLHGIISGPPFAAFPQVVEIAKDVSGQVFEAVSNEQQFRKWGRHYLPALRTAHVDQRCWNFKDPGVQAYGGAYFEQLRGDNEDIFNSMPPPQPSGVKTGQIPVAAVPKTMASFNNRSNSCHSGDSIVVMADGSRKRVDEIRVGDVVNCDDLRAAAVKCVLKTVLEDGELIPMCHISPNHKVTPYHPVRNGDKWQFPHEIAAPQDTPCKALYSFVLGAFHTISIDGVSAVTLGHKYTQDKVAHPYFGSQQVINDLIKLPGWDEGLVEITAADIHRDEHTGLINRIG